MEFVSRLLSKATGLRGRLVLLLVLAALPAFLLAWQAADAERTRATRGLKQEALRAAREIAIDHEATLQATRQLLAGLATGPALRNGGDCVPVLAGIAANPAIAWAGVIDLAGRPACVAPNAGPPSLDAPWVQDALAGRQLPGAAVAVPLRGAAGDVGGVLAVGLSLDWIGRRLAATDHPDATITVVDGNATILARYPEHGWQGRNIAGHPMALEMHDREGSALTTSLRADLRAFGYAQLGASEARVMVALPIAAAMAEIQSAFLERLFAIAAYAALFLCIALLATQELIIAPLRALGSAARQLSRGGLQARSGLRHGDDEIGALARGFDGMAAAVESLVTERTHALRDGEARFRMALQAAPVVVFAQDLELRYTWVYGARYIHSNEQYIGNTDQQMLPPDDAEKVTGLKRGVLASGVAARQFVTLGLGMESPRTFDLRIEPQRDEAGTVIGIMGSAIDVTEEQAKQAALAAARAEAEAANRTKTRFLAAASHDLRQPLQAMTLYLHVLIGKLSDPIQRELAQYLMQSADAARRLLDTLMGLSALETGQVRPDIRRVAVAPLLRRIADESRAEANTKGLRVLTHLPELAADTDAVLLERMVRNLVKNALRYTDAGGVLIAARRDGQGLRVEVWDTGPGIPADKLKAIFQDFYRVPGQPPVSGEHGLGLGLATVARMAELLGHETGVRSRQGKGSLFFIRISCAKRRLAAA